LARLRARQKKPRVPALLSTRWLNNWPSCGTYSLSPIPGGKGRRRKASFLCSALATISKGNVVLKYRFPGREAVAKKVSVGDRTTDIILTQDGR